MTPKRPGFHIPHDQAALPEHPGNMKVQLLILNRPGIHDAIETEVSPRRRDGTPAQLVVDDLTGGIGEHVDGIGPCLLA